MLGLAALTGFAQARHARNSARHVRWRVVHAGGTAGAVQLIALGAALRVLDAPLTRWYELPTLVGVALATWAFFLGPLLHALGKDRTARWVTLCGAVFAAPAYAALPLLVLL